MVIILEFYSSFTGKKRENAGGRDGGKLAGKSTSVPTY